MTGWGFLAVFLWSGAFTMLAYLLIVLWRDGGGQG